ncbi:MAG: DMT family transporter [Methanoregula sp.]|jgi:drug/metabolite transporter (DMT)-like permease|uniref:EamA family transporter n=1 Tax=Methanoregula sp. TaxID=2052170 RepID=UPI0025F8AF9F|nr:EamA family transporter [Methanoregula sp.]MCK9630382.1 DMT family transporter [Methanoregula sp.]
MFWALLSGIGACANSLYFIANKKFLQSIGPDILAASGFLFTSFFLLSIAVSRGIPALGPDFVFAVAATSTINVAATTLIFWALKSTDISLAVPMLSFTPLFLLVTAALLLHETPSVIGFTGIIIIVTGSYILNTAAEHTRLLDPFRSMVSHPGIFSMLIVSFLYAIAIGFDKMVVLNSDTVFGSGVVFLVIGSGFLGILLLKRRSERKRSGLSVSTPVVTAGTSYRHHRDILVAGMAIGLIVTIEAMAINTAYLEQIAPYVIAIKRMSILITVLYGTVVFHEGGIIRRISGAGLMVCGVVLILLFP